MLRHYQAELQYLEPHLYFSQEKKRCDAEKQTLEKIIQTNLIQFMQITFNKSFIFRFRVADSSPTAYFIICHLIVLITDRFLRIIRNF